MSELTEAQVRVELQWMQSHKGDLPGPLSDEDWEQIARLLARRIADERRASR